MHKIDTATATVDNLWSEGVPATSTPATRGSAEYFNAVQEEIAGFIEHMGLALAKGTNDQLDTAMDNLVGSLTHYGRPNLLRNGGFEYAQFATQTIQGSSQSALEQKIACADGWRFEAGNGSVSVRLDILDHAIGQTDVPDAGTKFLRWDVQAAGSGADQYLETRTDDLEELGSGLVVVTMSFWANLVSGATDVQMQLVQDFGAGGSPDNLIGMGTRTMAAGWNRYETTALVDRVNVATINAGACNRWRLLFTNDTGTYTIDIDNVKVELSPAVPGATPYVHEPIERTVRLCAPYFQTSYQLPDGTDNTIPRATTNGAMAFHQNVTSGGGEAFNAQCEFNAKMDHEPEVYWCEPSTQLKNTIEFPVGSAETVTSAAPSQHTTGYPDITSPPATTDDVGICHFYASAEIGEPDGTG